MNNRPTASPERGNRDVHLDEHQCLDLLQGFLSPEEEKGILLHLAGCPACERLLQERASEKALLEATRVLRTTATGELTLERRGTAARAREIEEKNGSILDFLSHAPASALAAFRRPRFQYAGGLAAAAAVILFVTWFQHSRSPGGPDLHMLPSYSFQLKMREAGGSAASEDLKSGLEAYDSKDFERAVVLLDRAGGSELSPTHEMVRMIYLGSALAWRGQHREAMEILEEVPLDLVPGEWGLEGQWTLAVALKESGREASADSLMQILATKAGVIGDRARGFLQKRKGD